MEIMNYIVEGIITLSIGVMTFFLKRTINEIDECRKEISECASKSEFNECKEEIVKIKEDYTTKEDFFREQTEIRRKLDRIMEILLDIKGEKHNG